MKDDQIDEMFPTKEESNFWKKAFAKNAKIKRPPTPPPEPQVVHDMKPEHEKKF